ncbi:MAG: methionyl-tRNA formyltransferase [Planctomycetota bacterium]|nr:methionyl-tRNA formyltransferase [Planctomycetota bacterium]
MRIVFCGSGGFAVPSLRALASSRHEVVYVVTQPARPAGRGGKVRHTHVAAAAGELRLAAVECPNINDPAMVQTIQTHRPDLIYVADFGQMVRAAVRQTAGRGAFNLHGSVLPELRGAAPINWALIRGFKHTGVSFFSLVDRMDAGEIYGTATTPVGDAETAEELHDRLADIGAELGLKVLDELEAGTARGVAQDESKATLAPKLKKEDGRLDFTVPADALAARINGACPWPGGQAVLAARDGRELPVTIARARARDDGAGRAPGELDSDMMIAAGVGRVEVLEIQPAGKKRMPWKAFLNGHRLAPGDRFVSVSS